MTYRVLYNRILEPSLGSEVGEGEGLLCPPLQTPPTNFSSGKLLLFQGCLFPLSGGLVSLTAFSVFQFYRSQFLQFLSLSFLSFVSQSFSLLSFSNLIPFLTILFIF